MKSSAKVEFENLFVAYHKCVKGSVNASRKRSDLEKDIRPSTTTYSSSTGERGVPDPKTRYQRFYNTKNPAKGHKFLGIEAMFFGPNNSKSPINITKEEKSSKVHPHMSAFLFDDDNNWIFFH